MNFVSQNDKRATLTGDGSDELSPQVGVVVIGRNEGARLAESLRSIDRALPIVYVDSGSLDESVALASGMGVPVLELDPARPFTAARARKEGAGALIDSYPDLRYIQFLDGDCILHAEWLATGVAELDRDAKLAAVCGQRSEQFPDASFYNRLFEQEWASPTGTVMATGGDAIFRVEAYRQVDGFDPELTAGEEPELAFRLREKGWKIEKLDTPMTMHDANVHRFGDWWKRAVRSGYGYYQAYRATRKGSVTPLYRRELARAFSWTVGVAMTALALAIVFGPSALLVAPAIWLAQYLRLALSSGFLAALHLMVGKAAEAYGALQAILMQVRSKSKSAISYK